MKTLLSLFDYSGNWSQPFAENGWNVIQWDIKLAEFMDINLIDDAETALDLFENVDGIIAATPCTEFTKSCAQYWPQKDQDGRTQKAIQLVYQTLKLVDLFRPTDPEYDGTFFWAVENPIGRIARLVPQLGDAYYFDPFEFAGWNNLTREDLLWLEQIRGKNGNKITKKEAYHIELCNAYTKRTGLWGEFNRNLKKRPIAPVKACVQGSVIQRQGGNSRKTKELRSITPLGFAQAFYAANCNHKIVHHLDLFNAA